jgi:NitT/TauT family transport system substrate-binding protein/putative hydroxymethylpyrimidine transport system substrate-binding protein
MRRLPLGVCLLALLAAAVLGGCGSASSGAHSPRPATVVLDFQPNAVHAGIYAALARGYDVSAGARLHVVVPSASTDSIKLLETGRANFAILDIHDLAIARERGESIVGIMALVQRPLAAVIAAPAIRDPRALHGQTVGVTGVPSDTAVLQSVVAGDGGDPARVRTVTIGFNAVADLLAGRVKAATAFWNDEGVTIERRRPGFHVFRVERYGAPSYPELVLCATASSLRSDPGLARGVVHALVRGYRAVLADPGAGARALEARVPGLDPGLVKPQLQALLPAFRLPGGTVGELDLASLRAWARWEARFGIVRRPPNVAATFDARFLPRGATTVPSH